MCLIDGDCREDPVGLLNRDIASIEFSGNIWVFRWYFSNVMEMNWDPADIVGVVQSNEPGNTLCQSIEVHAEGGPYKDQ